MNKNRLSPRNFVRLVLTLSVLGGCWLIVVDHFEQKALARFGLLVALPAPSGVLGVYEVVGVTDYNKQPYFIVIDPNGHRELAPVGELLNKWGEIKSTPHFFFQEAGGKATLLPDSRVVLKEKPKLPGA